MRKEKIKQLVDVMQAYVNGKTIQYYDADLSFKIEHPGEPNFNDKWVDVDEDHLFRPDLYDYRIKPESKYRSFKNAEECWQEMLNHQPFGWVLFLDGIKNLRFRACISAVYNTNVEISDRPQYDFKDAFKVFTFADGTPFGIKEE